jgi:rhamnopyranosyl-N-acetylglucosaminyl-diphospho-decaprenol beta-1,3/1,4-galactofuranosyltransferase
MSGKGHSDVSLVISVWNRKDDLRENLAAIREQTVAPLETIVVDNDSHDGTPEMVLEEFPEVKLIRMPHSKFGACTTFNVGFASAKGRWIGILDDDVVLPPEWIAEMLAEAEREGPGTAVLSSRVEEPEMPDWFLQSEGQLTPRYMATFRGCASLADAAEIRACGFYDEVLFIFGNERDLTARLLNRGKRVKYVPAVRVWHKAPFGMRAGRRSLYYHVRNFWIYAFKYVALEDILKFPFRFLAKGLGGKKKKSGVGDAVGTIGLMEQIRGVPGGWFVVMQATWSALMQLRYCWRNRQVCTHEDFDLPLH